ncbi:MAG: hypothetical protein ACRDKH_08705 [Solirubrobacterales bacterium]
MSVPAPLRRVSAASCALVLAAVGLGASATAAEAASCPETPKTLSPTGKAPERYTMLLRVNKAKNARTYANRDQTTGGLGGRIHPEDVFVVNTRHPGSSPAEWAEIVTILGRAFPCNRIVALNGLGADPFSPGYAYALSGAPQVWALVTDWERIDWNAGRFSNPRLKSWTGRFRSTEKRVRRWVGSVASALRRSSNPRRQRTGIVSQFKRKWDYGELGRAVRVASRNNGKRGFQSVQTQDFCADRGAGGMKVITRRLLKAYKSANFTRRRGRGKRVRHVKRRWRVKRANLGVQISFSPTPNPGAGMAVLSTPPGRAAGCTRSALKRGAGAVLYWASPDAIRLMLAVPTICSLRPSPIGVC